MADLIVLNLSSVATSALVVALFGSTPLGDCGDKVLALLGFFYHVSDFYSLFSVFFGGCDAFVYVDFFAYPARGRPGFRGGSLGPFAPSGVERGTW